MDSLTNPLRRIYIFGGNTEDAENPTKQKAVQLDEIYVLKLEYLLNNSEHQPPMHV